MEQRKCPLDGAPLTATTYETDIEVDQCAQCNGVWLDAGELESAQETTERDYAKERTVMPDAAIAAYQAARAKAERASLRCPACGDVELSAHEHGYCSQVFVDLCPGCGGVWLDRGELAELEAFFERTQRAVKPGFWAQIYEWVRFGVTPP